MHSYLYLFTASQLAFGCEIVIINIFINIIYFKFTYLSQEQTQQKGHSMVILTLKYLQRSNREQDTFKTSNSFRESVTVTNERVTVETDCRLLEDTVT